MWDRPRLRASLDVNKAVDQIEPRPVEKAMLFHRAITAVLQELVGQMAWPTVGEVETDEPVALANGASGLGARRAGSSTPLTQVCTHAVPHD